VKRVILNSPADKAGIKPGETIMKVDTNVTWLKSPEFVYGLLAGDTGTKVNIILWRKDHNYSVTLTREVINYQPAPLDTVNHKRTLPNIMTDEAFCDSFGRILDQAPDSFKKLHDNYIIYDNFDVSGGNGHYPYACSITLPGSSYTNYIYSDSLYPHYFIANCEFDTDASKAWQSFIDFSAQINQYLDKKTGWPCSYSYDINQRHENIDKTGRIWDAGYTFTLANINRIAEKSLEGTRVSVTYFSYFIQSKMRYYVSIVIWAS
jgi:hypothetical protein